MKVFILMNSVLCVLLAVDFRVAEFYIAPAPKGTEDEDVPESVYSSSGKYIDPVRISILLLSFIQVVGKRFCLVY